MPRHLTDQDGTSAAQDGGLGLRALPGSPREHLAGQRPGPGEPDERADVAVRVLGRLEVSADGVTVQKWGGTRIRTIFQYLLLNPLPVHREVLMELLWPGHTYSSARSNLNVCLYGLRRALSSVGSQEYVVYHDGYYELNPGLAWSVDRTRFVKAADRARRAAASGQTEIAAAHAEQALSEYRGPLFEGFPEADWFASERAALAELYVQTLECLAGIHLNRGDIDAAQRTAERLIREEGCRESAHRLLMICYARRSQHDLVARQFRRCVSKLQEELDISPSSETRRLYRELTDTSAPDGPA